MTKPEDSRPGTEEGQPTAPAWRGMRAKPPRLVAFWLLALCIGIAAGYAALLFRKGVLALQDLVYGAHEGSLADAVAALDWWWVLLTPIVAGLVVGLILHRFTPDGRARSVADVIEGAALRKGRVEGRAGLASVAASVITLGAGGSSGREGPVVHMAGVIATWVSDRIRADGITGRDLLGCAVAAAVSASFNAPIAGALFALEVVLRHFAVHAFAPIAIAAVAGTVVERIEFGNMVEFRMTDTLEFYVELPAFLLLGLLCGVVATVLMRGIFVADDVANRVQAATRMPRWLRPTIAGALLGLLAIWFPHIVGVGYQTTTAALAGEIALHEVVVFAVLKVVAVAITLGGRMGGGVFSPSLMIGALTGLAFGLVATALFPDTSGSPTLYALAGMGAVSAAVLGAPISTTMIVFELTADWQTGLAVMVAVSVSSALGSRLVSRSFFLTQLERRGLPMAAGPQVYIRSTWRIDGLARGLGAPDGPSLDQCREMAAAGQCLDSGASLETAINMFEETGLDFLPVVARGGSDGAPEPVGVLRHVDALKAYNRALVEVSEEEHA